MIGTGGDKEFIMAGLRPVSRSLWLWPKAGTIIKKKENYLPTLCLAPAFRPIDSLETQESMCQAVGR